MITTDFHVCPYGDLLSSTVYKIYGLIGLKGLKGLMIATAGHSVHKVLIVRRD